VVKNSTPIIYTSANFIRRQLKLAANALRKLQSGLARVLNTYIINALQLHSTQIGGPKDALLTFPEINNYVKINVQKAYPTFAGNFLMIKSKLKSPFIR